MSVAVFIVAMTLHILYMRLMPFLKAKR